MQNTKAPTPWRSGERLAVLLPGLGAVATTAIAGVEAVKRGLAAPVGSFTQLGTITAADGSPGPRARDVLSLPQLDELVFGGWDPIPDDAFEAALRAKVLERPLVTQLEEPLRTVKPMKAVFDTEWVRRLDGPNVKKGTRRALAEALVEDIQTFMQRNRCSRGVMVWTGSTEVYAEVGPAHLTVEAFEKALDADDRTIAPSMIYAYAAIKQGIPYANGAPNLSADIPALMDLA